MKRVLLLAAVAFALSAVAGLGDGGTARITNPRVGFVAYPGDRSTPRTLDGLALAGFARAQRRLAIRGRVQYLSPTQGAGSVMRSFSRQGYDLVVAPLFDATPVDSVARTYSHVHFVALDAQPGVPPKRHAKNIHRVVFRAEQAAYLAGYLSALMADRAGGAPMISAVGGYSFYGVNRWIVGFRAGARHADPRIRVRVDYSDDFANPAKCRRLALAQIAAGSRVVFNVAGTCGLGVLMAAKQRHVWGVGVDVDQSFLGPHILTSAISRYDRGVFDAIHRFTQGRLGTAAVYDLHNGGVELGRINKRVPAELKRRLARVQRQIVNGTIVVPRPRG